MVSCRYTYQLRVVFTHRHGEDIPLADNLSRVFISDAANDYVQHHTARHDMTEVKIFPAMHNYSSTFELQIQLSMSILRGPEDTSDRQYAPAQELIT